MYAEYKLNKQGDTIQSCCTPFSIWNQLVFLCPALTVASWPVYRFLRRPIRRSGIPISWRIFHSLFWSTQSETLEYSMKQMFFWSYFVFFYDPTDFGNLVSGPCAFSKSSLNNWNLSIHVLKPSLENFEHYFASLWDEWITTSTVYNFQLLHILPLCGFISLFFFVLFCFVLLQPFYSLWCIVLLTCSNGDNIFWVLIGDLKCLSKSFWQFLLFITWLLSFLVCLNVFISLCILKTRLLIDRLIANNFLLLWLAFIFLIVHFNEREILFFHHFIF